ncbi:hypothetical protein IMW63_03960 [Ehrlichia ruminantium]|uniref:hypothetical protein n=1 Tax=Ehrlichia ruminantium TaxID=779 RepID=UPI001FB4AF7D|nr:hypothetical protein [Ehrlichia ruminantium]UOD98609.1 hypothetical protein IMW63_03960 [Ehrlichia ruminantium]
MPYRDFAITWLAILIACIITICVLIHVLCRYAFPDLKTRLERERKAQAKMDKLLAKQNKSLVNNKQEEKSEKEPDRLSEDGVQPLGCQCSNPDKLNNDSVKLLEEQQGQPQSEQLPQPVSNTSVVEQGEIGQVESTVEKLHPTSSPCCRRRALTSLVSDVIIEQQGNSQGKE